MIDFDALVLNPAVDIFSIMCRFTYTKPSLKPHQSSHVASIRPRQST